jgi:hypothetical protein
VPYRRKYHVTQTRTVKNQTHTAKNPTVTVPYRRKYQM